MNDLIDSNGSWGKVVHYEDLSNDMHIVCMCETPRDYRAKKCR